MGVDVHPSQTATPETALDIQLRELIAGIVARREAALAGFYDATAGKVYGLALRILRQPQAAEEVVEDVYLQVWRDAGRYSAERGRPLTWLLTICRSRALDYLRRADDAELHADPDELRQDLDSGEGDPLDILQATETASLVHQALAALGPVPRQLVALAFMRGLTHQEIAQATRMPLGTVKSTLRRACEQMREWLLESRFGPNDHEH